MSLFNRKIDIDINPGQEGELVLVTTLQDMYHHICLTLNIDTNEYMIRKAYVEMERIPSPNCHRIEEKVLSLVGAQVGPGFTREVLSIFKGENGCPNLANLIFLTAPLAINAAAVLRQQQEQLTQDELDDLWQDALGGKCIAYSKKQQGE